MSRTKKLAIAGILIALGVVGSSFAIPVGIAKCAPVQHMINVIAGVFLGPWYALGMAFTTSLIRVMTGLGSPLAFPGSMFGAFLCGMLYKIKPNFFSAFFGEIIGTGLIGAIAAYPVAVYVMNSTTAALFGFVIPFSVSTVAGSLISLGILISLKKTKVYTELK